MNKPDQIGRQGSEAGKTEPRPLPRGFVWGASTSSYQVEGAVREDGRGASIWDTFCRQAGRVANGDVGDVACDHYHRYRDDILLMRDIGLDAYQFSVAWPRILPHGRGGINERGLDFYDRLIDQLLAAKIEPWLCLYHWDLPQELDDFGGWTSRDSVGWFSDYVAVVARRYGDRVKRFITFVEPSTIVLYGYGFGWLAPGISERAACYKAMHHINLAHGAAVDVVRGLVTQASIGASYLRQFAIPETDSAQDRTAAQAFDEHATGAFELPQHFACYPPGLSAALEPYQRPGDLARICRPVDWLGVNYYAPFWIRADANATLGFMLGEAPPELKRTGIGWPIDPKRFKEALLDAHHRFRLPIYVLENGCAFPDKLDAAGNVDDPDRVEFLRAYTDAMRDAIAAGADIRGYFVWSLLDNFEWQLGYTQRFGLIYVDYPTQRRIPKASARWYAQLIASTGGRATGSTVRT